MVLGMDIGMGFQFKATAFLLLAPTVGAGVNGAGNFIGLAGRVTVE